MKIFRVEHCKTGDGPFSRDGHNLCEVYGSDYVVEHRPPRDDGMRKFDRSNLSFGCLSLEDVFFWFEDYFNWLQAHGFVVRVFEINDPDLVETSRSGKQCAFPKGKAVMVEEIPI